MTGGDRVLGYHAPTLDEEGVDPIRIVILLAGLAAAQNHTVYPIDVLPGDSSQVIPLGAFSFSSNFDETRSHFLIPGPYLPTTGGLLTALHVAPLITQTGTLVYSNLTIRMENTTIGMPESRIRATAEASITFRSRARTS